VGLPGRHAIELFATADDLRLLVQEVEAARAIHFGRSGLLDVEAVPLRQTLVSSDAPLEGEMYLVQDRESPFTSSAVPQRGGGMKYSVSQLENPRSVSIRCGRRIGEEYLSPGHIGTISSDPASLDLFDLFRRAAAKHFTRVNSYWLGPDAERMLDAGAKLAVSPKTPAEYDLRR